MFHLFMKCLYTSLDKINDHDDHSKSLEIRCLFSKIYNHEISLPKVVSITGLKTSNFSYLPLE